MVEIKGYTHVGYNEMQTCLHNKFEETGKTVLNIANDLGVRTINTVKNAMSKGDQLVSDALLTNLSQIIGIPILIAYLKGGRYYYVGTPYYKKYSKIK